MLKCVRQSPSRNLGVSRTPRSFQGPGIENFDMQISKTVNLGESRSLDIRVEAFNVFNHAQFYGPSAVDGEVNDSDFGHVVSAAAPREIQLAMKIHFYHEALAARPKWELSHHALGEFTHVRFLAWRKLGDASIA
jgi:hypothetical protein